MSVFLSRLTEQKFDNINYAGYLEGDKASHLNTGIYASDDLVVEIKYVSLETYSAVMGCEWDDYGYFLHDWSGSVGFQAFGVTTSLGTSDKTNGNTVKLAKGRCTMNGVTTAVTGTSANKTTNPIYLFNEGSNANPGHRGKIRIYYCRMWQGGVLVRDMWPCYDKDGVACMWDKVTRAYFRNEGTGTFTAGGVSMQKVTFLEYLESTGTQYVDTEFKPNQDTRVVMDVQMTAENESLAANELFGARTSTSSKVYAVQWNTANNYFQHFYNNGYDNLSFGDFAERQIVEMNKNVLSINGVTHERTYSAFQCDYSLYLCCLNNAGTAAFFSKMRVCSSQVYDNGKLIRDYWPAYDWGGYPCLYDKVSGQHEYSVVGTFVAGGVVESSVTFLEYIQSSGTQYFDTGFKPNQNSRVVMDVESKTTGTGFYFGARTDVKSKTFSVPHLSSTSVRNDHGTTQNTLTVAATNKRATLDRNGATLTFDGYSTTNTAATFTCDYSLFLLAVNSAGTMEAGLSAKLYASQVYDNGTLFGDYHPAYDWCGRACLFDKVSKQFLPNAGTGEFIAGGVAA